MINRRIDLEDRVRLLEDELETQKAWVKSLMKRSVDKDTKIGELEDEVKSLEKRLTEQARINLTMSLAIHSIAELLERIPGVADIPVPEEIMQEANAILGEGWDKDE